MAALARAVNRIRRIEVLLPIAESGGDSFGYDEEESPDPERSRCPPEFCCADPEPVDCPEPPRWPPSAVVSVSAVPAPDGAGVLAAGVVAVTGSVSAESEPPGSSVVSASPPVPEAAVEPEVAPPDSAPEPEPDEPGLEPEAERPLPDPLDEPPVGSPLPAPPPVPERSPLPDVAPSPEDRPPDEAGAPDELGPPEPAAPSLLPPCEAEPPPDPPRP
jgi:hypothetical protein